MLQQSGRASEGLMVHRDVGMATRGLLPDIAINASTVATSQYPTLYHSQVRRSINRARIVGITAMHISATEAN